MRICILHIGHTDPNDNFKHPLSPERFERGISSFLSAQWTTISVINDTLPSPCDYDGYLITGGKYSAYETYDWQNRLQAFIVDLHTQKIPLIGICYGHQIIAQALGGKVVNAKQGWGIGIKSSDVVFQPEWMQDAPSTVYLYSMHQDQVAVLPTSAKRFLTSDFCIESGFVVGNHILCIQQHPDFNAEICRDLIHKRKAYMGDMVDSGLESLTQPHHTELSCKWMADFFEQHVKN